MPGRKIIVLKFGSSVLRGEDDLPRVVHEIYRYWREGAQVLVVVSALGDTTDRLLHRAESICAKPDESALAILLATGETTASALLGIALEKAGLPVKVLDAAQAGLCTSGGRLDAALFAVDRKRLLSESEHSVLVLPGFLGRDGEGQTTLLGRGGSDFSALFLAQQLHAECLLIKDVDGLYTSDPACRAIKPAQRFARTSYETACRVGGVVVQPKAVQFAAAHNQTFTVTAIGTANGTKVGPVVDTLAAQIPSQVPLRVALIGCGTVGGGVYERLLALPELFTVSGVAVRDRNRLRKPHVPPYLLTEDPERLIERPCDVVVELIGGTDKAGAIVRQALDLGRHVVTANKALIALEGVELLKLAERSGVSVQLSAAVGGALPALETVRHARTLGSIKGFSGILNSTTNFILDQISQGVEFDAAVLAAQAAGYAEADPTLDLDGTDAAQKLGVLAREVFGVPLPFENISRKGILDFEPARMLAAKRRGCCIRAVATCKRTTFGLEATVAPIELPQDHPLAGVTGARNRLLVELEGGGQLVVSGIGAGRWPTTEAVIADLLYISRAAYLPAQAEQELEECVA
ncbi:MAG TPA: homoserine dehydrogenase [Pyrinomonadaceae bacterium]|nr:homoserine dehydrogenase [Pyrinomonadaceae bacterium]